MKSYVIILATHRRANQIWIPCKQASGELWAVQDVWVWVVYGLQILRSLHTGYLRVQLETLRESKEWLEQDIENDTAIYENSGKSRWDTLKGIWECSTLSRLFRKGCSAFWLLCGHFVYFGFINFKRFLFHSSFCLESDKIYADYAKDATKQCPRCLKTSIYDI